MHAPAEDGVLVADPPLAEVGGLLLHNRHKQQQPLLLLGRPLAELQAQARQSALESARSYLQRQGEPIPDIPVGGLVLLAGHQPELFHPGVWVKNFALHGLAQAHGGIALNLVIDNDTVKSTSLRIPHPPGRSGEPSRTGRFPQGIAGAARLAAPTVGPASRAGLDDSLRESSGAARADDVGHLELAAPTGSDQEFPYLQQVPFDRWPGETPIEEWTIQDPDLFRSFADRAGSVLADWGYRPLLPDFWTEVCRLAEVIPEPGTCFASARRSLERRWGCWNLEVPLSVLCDSEPFAWFACDLLGQLPRFHSIYNRCVAEYRRAHRIRSRNHPVPDLSSDAGFLEAPLWGWRTGQKRRWRLLVRQRGDRLELRAGTERWPDLPIPEEKRMPQVLEAWRGLQAAGYRIRTRALSTTLFSRLLLADLFLHGIGGGKYDEVTDSIARQFYQHDLPDYLVLSATKLLPLPAYPVTVETRSRLLRALRDVRYQPERVSEGGDR